MEWFRHWFALFALDAAIAALGVVALVALARACRGTFAALFKQNENARSADATARGVRGRFAAIAFAMVAIYLGTTKPDGGGMMTSLGEMSIGGTG